MVGTDLQTIEAKPVTDGMDLQTLGETLAKSKYFADAGLAPQAIVKVLAGRELGIGAIASMCGIYIVKGRVTLSANLMAATIKRSGRFKYKVLEHDDTHCVIEFFERETPSHEWESVGKSGFSTQDAQRAGINKPDSAWRGHPKNMCFARAMSNGCKWYAPDVFGGSSVYTPDELGAVVDPATGEVEVKSLKGVQRVEAEVIEDPKNAEPAAESAIKRLVILAQKLEWDDDERHKQAEVASFKDLTHGQARDLQTKWQRLANEKAKAEAKSNGHTVPAEPEGKPAPQAQTENPGPEAISLVGPAPETPTPEPPPEVKTEPCEKTKDGKPCVLVIGHWGECSSDIHNPLNVRQFA
ncbi:MAG: hypothetical protein ACR2M4_05560 [Actinomycetota bacterium]